MGTGPPLLSNTSPHDTANRYPGGTTEEAAIASIFLSYRRGREASEAAGRLHDRLASRFGSDAVFMDVDTVRPGADFVQAIGEAIDPRGAVLAIIDPGWAVDTSGRNRITEPGDYVRLEIATAL